jgi:hypothetical protein
MRWTDFDDAEEAEPAAPSAAGPSSDDVSIDTPRPDLEPGHRAAPTPARFREDVEDGPVVWIAGQAYDPDDVPRRDELDA